MAALEGLTLEADAIEIPCGDSQLKAYVLNQLEKLTKDVDCLIFPASLNAKQRKLAHELAQESKLCSASCGSGVERRLQVFKPGKLPQVDLHREEQLSRKLSSLLRHSAEQRGIGILSDGFAPLAEILALPEFRAGSYTVEEVEQLLRRDPKRRFELTVSASERWLRATQGHTMRLVQDDELLTPLQDLGSCIHGTYLSAWQEIRRSGGLSRMARNHIHFTTRLPTDQPVSGMRSDCQVAIYVSAASAMAAGIKFFQSCNGVILTPGDTHGRLSLAHVEKVVCLADGHILWPEPASDEEVVLLPQSNFLCDPKADSDEEVVFCKPMISMDLPKWSYILDSY